MSSNWLTAALAVGIWLTPLGAGAADSAGAIVKDRSGKTVGSVMLIETPNGTLVTARFRGLPPGAHGFHVHAVGKCEPPFTSAGVRHST